MIRELPRLLRRHRGAAIAIVAALLLAAATSDVALALVVAASAVVVATAVAKLPASRRRPGIALGVLVAIVVTAGTGHALSPGQPTVVVPAPLVPLPANPTATQVAASLVDQQPDLASSWLLFGDTGDATSFSGSAFVGYERALILDPGDRRAALGLAGLYLARNQSLLDDEIAAFFTRLAGYHAPPLHPAS